MPILVRGAGLGQPLPDREGRRRAVHATGRGGGVTLAAWAAVAVDHARLYAEAERRRAALETAVTRLEATRAIARAIGTETDLHRVLELIVKRARALVDARALVLLLADGDELLVAAGRRAGRQPRARRAAAARGHGDGRGARARPPERVADVPVRLALGDDALGVVGAETGAAGAARLPRRGRSACSPPSTGSTGSDGFGDDDEQLLEAFAASAATAVATAQRAERHQLRRAHRRRRARAPPLGAASCTRSTLQGLGACACCSPPGCGAGDPEALEQAAREAVQRSATEIARLRRLIIELRPAALDELGPAARDGDAGRARRRAARARGAAALRRSATERLGPGARDDGLPDRPGGGRQRAAPRATPTAWASTSAATAGALVVAVADDGDGFDPEAPGAGFGLAGMRERAPLAGGTLEVARPRPGRRSTARFPRAGGREPSAVDEPVVERVAHELGAGGAAELLLHVGAVGLHRAHATGTAAGRSRRWCARARSAAGSPPRAAVRSSGGPAGPAARRPAGRPSSGFRYVRALGGGAHGRTSSSSAASLST